MDIPLILSNTRLKQRQHIYITHAWKKFNSKCNAVIQIFYAQTHHLCIYTTSHLESSFPMFVDEVMQECVVLSFEVSFTSLLPPT